MTLGFYGGDGYGNSPYGSVPALVGVESAEALNGTHVQVNFTQLLDFTFPQLLLPSNYTIPGLTVIAVEETAENAVLLTTSQQTNIVYTVTVTAARSTLGTQLNPLQNSAQFTGFPLVPGYFAVATAVRRVRAVFSQAMLNDSNLSDPANYTITDFNGNAVFILTATPEQSLDPTSVLLALGTDLVESDFYVCTVSSNIKTETGLNVLPPTSVFQWLLGNGQFQVPMSSFSGEVQGFPLPVQFGGLVYFSPALNIPTANSIIQVDEVDVCTTAYDTYTFPKVVDPPILITYGGGIVPTPNPDPYLLNQTVLWAPFPRNFEAKIELGFTGEANNEEMPTAVDTSCSVIIKEQFKYGYVAFLNDTAYYLLPKSTPPEPTPPMFITANNLSPIPPGKETILVLHVALSGTSTFHLGRGKVVAHSSATMAGDSQLFAGAGPPPVVLAQASIAGGSHFHAHAHITKGAFTSLGGEAFVHATAIVPPPPINEWVALAGSDLSAFATVTRAVAASPTGDSNVSATGGVQRGALANLSASSTLTSAAKARWAAHTAIQGTSSVFADATVTHKAEAFPTGIASVSATAT